MDLDDQLQLAHLLLQERKCRVCGEEKNLIDGYYRTRKNVRLASSYSYECKECTVKRVCENNRRNRLKKNRIKKMKQTENLQQLMERFTKRLKQVNPDDKERVSYLKGCIDTVDYLATGKLPNDGNHDGMKNHRPRHSQLDALD
jgi:CRISPR/Cas system-associated protein Cas10 (large subunit of type III CRISPR-Cas system)